jgi:hypothetical protein
MRPTYGVSQDDGLRRSHQCPPSHHEMALTPKYAQAAAQAPQPSQPSTGSPMLSAPVSPYHQQGSTMPSGAPAAYSSRHLVPFTSMGGGSPHTRPHDCSYGSMAPSPANTEATLPLPSLAHPSPPARSYPSHPHRTMGGIPEGSMAPSPATTEVATPSLSSARPFLPTWSSPTHPLTTMGGSAASAASHALERSQQRLAFTMSKCPGFADANPWVMENINAVAHELQCWNQRHSIHWHLAGQTRQRLAATTIQCWKRRIWLDCWFAQQALQCQKCLRLQLLCRGALAYAVSVWGDCRPTPTPTDKTSDTKVLRHLFWDCDLPLPQRRRARQNNCPCRHPGRRHWTRASDSGGGLLCMPLCFWAAQSAVAASELCLGTGRSLFSPYLPPHTAATAIQCVYRSYVDKVIKEYLPPHTAATAIQRVYHSYVDKVIVEWLQLSLARYAFERDMHQAMHNLLVCNSYWIPCCDDV